MSRLVTTCLAICLGAGLCLAQQPSPTQSSVPSTYQMSALAPLTEFGVRGGVLKPIRGKPQDCKNDQRFLQGAMQTRKVTLARHDHHVKVSQGTVDWPGRGSEAPLRIFLYQLNLAKPERNKALAAYLKRLAGKPYESGLVSTEKSPITGHFFSRKNTLYILAHYGLPAYYVGLDMEAVILDVKARE